MARLIGAQRMVLQAILDLPKDPSGFVTNKQVAQSTQVALGDVRNWLETLEGDGHINIARTTGGLSASITAQGHLAPEQFRPFPSTPSGATAATYTTNLTSTSTTPLGTPPVRTIPILAANPKGTQPLRLNEEVKKIDQGLERAKRRDQFKLVQKWAVTDDDLRRALLDNEPEIVHFSGHGSGADGLAFEDDSGHIQLISGDALSRLFELCADSVKCVVLNACYSEAQADAIAGHIDFVVGMKKAIGDEAAIKFAVGFYFR